MVIFDLVLVGGKIQSNSAEAFSLFEKQRFGERDNGKIFYMLEEAYFLLESNKVRILSNNFKEISIDETLKKFIKLSKTFFGDYLVFKDLRKKGFVVKSGLKFGSAFRVYEKGQNISKTHSKWICFPSLESENITWRDFAGKMRVAHSTKKHLLIGVIDAENDVSYYDVNWEKII